MPRLKLLEPGWETLTGDFGGVLFDNGVSTEEVSPYQALRLSSIVRIRDAVSGQDYSVSQVLIDIDETPMDGTMEPQDLTLIDHGGATETGTLGDLYTVADLEAIASAGGIKALRVIAEPYNISGKKIVELIGGLIRVGARMPAPVPADQRAGGDDTTFAAQLQDDADGAQNDGAEA